MPRLGPVKRRDLIRFLKELGFEGPYANGRPELTEANGNGFEKRSKNNAG